MLSWPLVVYRLRFVSSPERLEGELNLPGVGLCVRWADGRHEVMVEASHVQVVLVGRRYPAKDEEKPSSAANTVACNHSEVGIRKWRHGHLVSILPHALGPSLQVAETNLDRGKFFIRLCIQIVQYNEFLNNEQPKSKLRQNPNGREFRFQTTFWSFKLNATSSDWFIAINRVRFWIF